jgi:hypothetical protein
MNLRLLTAHDPAWDRYLARLPGADVYHTAAYHRAHEANGDGTALAFVAEEGGSILFHPFMQREIRGGVIKGEGVDVTPFCGYDAETVYGYSGPLIQHEAADRFFSRGAWGAFDTWCRDHRVVAEFLRFNPLSGNFNAVTHNVLITPDRETVVLDLAGTKADLWPRYTKTHRNMVRRALAHGLSVDLSAPGASLLEFWNLYQDTMRRVQACDYYRFGAAYVETLRHGLAGSLVCITVRDRGRPVASALFLLHRDRMHYHLAGSDPDYSGGDNNLLLHEAALWGQRHGYRWLHLGGGRTNAPDDSLLRFKASISRERRPFYVGRRIHDPDTYERLCEGWRRLHPNQSPGNYFLLWRKP